MTTTLAPIAGSVEPRGGVPVDGHSAGWAASGRADIGTLPGCRLRRVIEYIQQNLDKGLSLAELAGVVYMSPYHFARLFKQSTGVPPHRFVLGQRIERASVLLRDARLSIGEVASLVGFRRPSHFTTAFRRMTGSTPSAYRCVWRHER